MTLAPFTKTPVRRIRGKPLTNRGSLSDPLDPPCKVKWRILLEDHPSPFCWARSEPCLAATCAPSTSRRRARQIRDLGLEHNRPRRLDSIPDPPLNLYATLD